MLLYVLFVFIVLCIVCVYMCTVLLPPGGYPVAVKYVISYHIISFHFILYILSYHIYHISYHVIYHIIYHIVSYHISYHIYTSVQIWIRCLQPQVRQDKFVKSVAVRTIFCTLFDVGYCLALFIFHIYYVHTNLNSMNGYSHVPLLSCSDVTYDWLFSYNTSTL